MGSKKFLRQYFDLLIGLSVKELKIKFKGACLGFLWTILNPLLMMLVLSIIFTKVVRINIEKYPLFVLCGLLPWNFLTSSIIRSANIIIENASLIKKVPLPMEIFPLSVVFSNLINFLICMGLLVIFFAFHIEISVKLLLLPVIILLQLIFTAGMCFLFSCITVFFRDVNNILNILLMLWFYLTPVIYPLEMVPEKFYILCSINPMTMIIHSYREVLLKNTLLLSPYFFIFSALLIVAIFTISYSIFSHYKQFFSEVV